MTKGSGVQKQFPVDYQSLPQAILAAALWMGLGAFAAEVSAPLDPNAFIGFTSFDDFRHEQHGGERCLVSPVIQAPRPYTELIVSWNAVCPTGAQVQVEARGFDQDRPTKYFVLGLWSEDPTQRPRASVKDQKDADGDVQTDTLILSRPMTGAQLRFILRGARSSLPVLKHVGLAFHDSHATPVAGEPDRRAWGQTLAVPERVQIGYPDAEGWCSPTCVAMVLAYWSGVLKRPELDLPAPVVAKAVNDPNWPGTGNWVFNTAFAGHFDGLRAYVTRLNGLNEVEPWLAAGVPVALSVSFDLLNGKAEDLGNGHLIVVVGFNEQGDVVINDPWPAPKKENRVRKVFPRERVVKAWQRSKQAVYLIYPEHWKIPRNELGHWEN